MRELLIYVTESVVLLTDAIALIIITIGTVGAFFGSIKLWSSRHASAETVDHERRRVWLRYARWLVAGLTFQLASDIIESSIATDWDTVGRLAAIAVVRTFLNYFLERDLNDLRERQREAERTATVE